MLPPPGYQDPLETWSEKFARKFKENPWVPIGCLATCGALVMSAIKLRAGKSSEMNYWLRARVGLQGLTLAALVVGSMAIQNARKEEMAQLNAGEGEGELAQKKEKEKLEFEERLKEAQAATEMEEGLSKKVVKGPAVKNEKREERMLAGQSGASEPAANATSAAVKESKTWRWWSKKESDNDSS